MTPLISIILPVYNVEKYLEECLESIRNQTFSDWECIIVDDGSQDNSSQICEDYTTKDSRFKIIHQPNGGLSSARNAGLRIASGKYIAFIDSDDWIDKNYLKVLYDIITEKDADMAICGYTKEFRTFRRNKPLKYPSKIITERNQAVGELLIHDRLPGYVWNKLFKREIIDSPFPEGHVYEDFYVLTNWAPNISKIALSELPLYHYRVRKSSISKSGDSRFQLDFMEAIRLRVSGIKRLLPQQFDDKSEQNYYYRHLLERAKIIARKEADPNRRKENIEVIRQFLSELPSPDNIIIGEKLYKRAQILLKSPETFIKKMRIAQFFDLHDRYCASQAFK